MKKPETLERFYANHGILDKIVTEFNVFQSEGYCNEPMIYNRRDFYKISLLLGASRLHWRHRTIEVDRPALVFFNPLVSFGWEPLSREQPGYFCLFKKEFLRGARVPEFLRQSALFQINSHPVTFLDKAEIASISELFIKMLAEIKSDYPYKYDVLRSYVHLLIHEAIKRTAETKSPVEQNASERLTASFLELLEKQFPVDSPGRSLRLRSPGDYAKALSVHVNHLNHAIKELTGKTTSQHIADRVIAEAIALLRHTNWTVAEIAGGLGFEYPNHFHNFFKRKTGYAPNKVRINTL